MMKVIQIAEGAFFVQSYSEQTIMHAYTIDATVQSFGLDDWIGEDGQKKENKRQELEVKVDPTSQLACV